MDAKSAHNSLKTKTNPAGIGAIHKVAGLFAGVGGLEVGLHRAGHRTNILCENEPGAASVLEKRFRGIDLHDDVRTLGSISSDTTLLCGGFPCQDLSQAGRTKGIQGTRSSLVGEIFRLLEKQRTPWVFLENVPFMLQLGRGQAMQLITSAFEELGYRWAYRVIDALSFGLPQRRRRVYLIASTEADPRSVLFADEAVPRLSNQESWRSVACGFYWTEGTRGLGWAEDAVPTLKGGSTIGIPSPPAIVLPSGEVVTPDIRDAERLQGFRTDWTKPAERIVRPSRRWLLVGNAVSVPVAAWIGRRLSKPGEPKEYELRRARDEHDWGTAGWNTGDGRCVVNASEWPVVRKRKSLTSFLRYPGKALSVKATRGFLSRAYKSSLKFPPSFLQLLERHAARMERGVELRETKLSQESVSSESLVQQSTSG